jgi:galactitol-specific phosphotransferase system IIC component
VHVAREHEIHAGRVQQRLGVEAESKLLGLVVVLGIGVVPSSINKWPRFYKTP